MAKEGKFHFPVPDHRIDSTEEGLRWLMEQYKDEFSAEKADALMQKYHAEPRHISLVRLDRWVEREISDASLEQHLQEVGAEHIKACERCTANLEKARTRYTSTYG